MIFTFSDYNPADKKKSSIEEQRFQKFNSIIAENEQKSNELRFFFSKQALAMADNKKLIELERLASEVSFKWCRDAVKKEWERRAI